MFKWLKKLGLVLFEGDSQGDKGDAGKGKAVEFTKEQQEAVNGIVQERLAREKEKYRDYEELQKFKTEHQKQLDAQTQKDLEAKKEYDKAKEGYEKKLTDMQGVISQKEQALVDARIGYNLDAELSKQNAYIEEARALLKGQVSVGQDGSLFIKGKDANSLDVNLTIEQGVKDFLAKRPHLVKANARSGAGTTAAAAGDTSAATGADDLMKLNEEYISAVNKRDIKRAQELRTKIKGFLTAKGVNRNA
jgi:hypothetical protein